MEQHNAYRQKMEAQLKEWSAQINLLEAKLDNVAAEMKIMLAEDIHALRAKQHAAADQLKELGKSTGEAWDQVKLSADKLWDDLKAGLAEAQKKFK